jgi:hypothetical protein
VDFGKEVKIPEWVRDFHGAFKESLFPSVGRGMIGNKTAKESFNTLNATGCCLFSKLLVGISEEMFMKSSGDVNRTFKDNRAQVFI